MQTQLHKHNKWPRFGEISPGRAREQLHALYELDIRVCVSRAFTCHLLVVHYVILNKSV